MLAYLQNLLNTLSTLLAVSVILPIAWAVWWYRKHKTELEQEEPIFTLSEVDESETQESLFLHERVGELFKLKYWNLQFPDLTPLLLQNQAQYLFGYHETPLQVEVYLVLCLDDLRTLSLPEQAKMYQNLENILQQIQTQHPYNPTGKRENKHFYGIIKAGEIAPNPERQMYYFTESEFMNSLIEEEYKMYAMELIADFDTRK